MQNRFRKTELFLTSRILNPTILQAGARVMSDETRKKHDMTTIQPQNAKPGSLAPNASISRKLRDFYDAVQEEGIPDRFLDLLERLEEAENAQKAGAKAVDAK
jgi:hypothetical protein